MSPIVSSRRRGAVHCRRHARPRGIYAQHATGASTADLAVVLVDARRGVLPQTRRHSYIASLMGIRHVVLAVNKLDLVGFVQATFDAIAAEYRSFAAELGFETIVAIPLSARLATM